MDTLTSAMSRKPSASLHQSTTFFLLQLSPLTSVAGARSRVANCNLHASHDRDTRDLERWSVRVRIVIVVPLVLESAHDGDAVALDVESGRNHNLNATAHGEDL
jgi:hypothetical protein